METSCGENISLQQNFKNLVFHLDKNFFFLKMNLMVCLLFLRMVHAMVCSTMRPLEETAYVFFFFLFYVLLNCSYHVAWLLIDYFLKVLQTETGFHILIKRTSWEVANSCGSTHIEILAMRQ